MGVRVGGSDEDDTLKLSPMARAVRDTQQTVGKSADRVDRLDAKVDLLDAKVDGLAISSARVEGQVGILVDELQAARTIRVSTVQATIEVEKTGEIARVEDAAALRRYKRQLVLKITGIVGSVAAAAVALVTLLASRC